jgi:hypothetical protein
MDVDILQQLHSIDLTGAQDFQLQVSLMPTIFPYVNEENAAADSTSSELREKYRRLTNVDFELTCLEDSDALEWLSKLPALTRLHLHQSGSSWGHRPPEEIDRMRDAMIKMQCLERLTATTLSHVYSDQADRMLPHWTGFFHHLPSLTHLSIEITHDRHNHGDSLRLRDAGLWSDALSSIARCPKLRQLSFDGIFAGDLLALTRAWSQLLTSGIDPSLERLALTFDQNDPDAESYTVALQELDCMSHLHHLSVTMHASSCYSGVVTRLSVLPQLKRLRSLQIEDETAAHGLTDVIELWCKPLSFPHLHTLSISTSARLDPVPTKQPWASLPQLLTLPKLQLLQLGGDTFIEGADRRRRNQLRHAFQQANDTRTPAIDLQFSTGIWNQFSSLSIDGE